MLFFLTTVVKTSYTYKSLTQNDCFFNMFKRSFFVSIFTISDLHLALGIDKPMDIFGKGWENYMERLFENWNNLILKDDTVVIGGDISWATYLNEAYKDFEYIEHLNGRKIILKGNHDYWWESITKLTDFVKDNSFSSISFLHNNAYLAENIAICGTRGWIDPTFDNFSGEDKKIYDREIMRLELSLNMAKKFDAEKTFVFLHYPPITKNLEINSDYANVLKKFNVKNVFYGHIHSAYSKKSLEGEFDGINYKLVSADYLSFMPYKLT